MTKIHMERASITIDIFLAENIRRMFNNNLSLGINQLLEEYFKEHNPIKETFGTFKFKKSTQKIMDEIDRELWGEKD